MTGQEDKRPNELVEHAPVTSAPSTSATSVLNTRSGETPSASLASVP